MRVKCLIRTTLQHNDRSGLNFFTPTFRWRPFMFYIVLYNWFLLKLTEGLVDKVEQEFTSSN